MNLLDCFKERPLDEKPSDPATCPYCGSGDTQDRGTTTTLVGFSGPVDPNHQWNQRACRGCHKGFVREIKGLNVWYTAERVHGGPSIILKGIPSCFEAYQYTCPLCEGPVLQKQRNLQGGLATVLSSREVDGKWVRGYTTHYHCTQCGHGGQVDSDYYHG